MHDPNILAFEIKYPWWKKNHAPWPKKHRHSESRKFEWDHRMTADERKGRDRFWEEGYRDTFISIWHLDPEKGGSDDSCGWSYVNLTKKQKSILRNMAWHEGKHPHFLRQGGKEWIGTFTDAEILYRGLVLLVADVLRIKCTFEQAARMVSRAIQTPDCCPAMNRFCFQPGYHSNFAADNPDHREQHFFEMLCGVARTLLTAKRPWWNRPRWHFWHWRFQVHPWQSFKRAFIDRCSKCGKGFKWGESCLSDWHGTRIWHEGCDKDNQKNTAA